MPRISNQLTDQNAQSDCSSDGHETGLRRAQLSQMVHAATRVITQLQRDGECSSYVATRLAEASYALHRAAVALGEIDDAVQGQGADTIPTGQTTSLNPVG